MRNPKNALDEGPGGVAYFPVDQYFVLRVAKSGFDKVIPKIHTKAPTCIVEENLWLLTFAFIHAWTR